LENQDKKVFQRIEKAFENKADSLSLGGESLIKFRAQVLALAPYLLKLQIAPTLLNSDLNNPYSAEVIEIVSNLTNLRKLEFFSFKNLGYTGLKTLTKLKEIEELRVSLGKDGPDSLKLLSEFKKLKNLSFSSVAIGDDGLNILAQIKTLESLTLVSHGITESGAKIIAELPNLTTLNLGGNKIGDVGVNHICSLTRLTWLQLDGCSVSDLGLKQIVTRLTNLRHLNLTGNNIKHLEPLRSAGNIIDLKISDNPVQDFPKGLTYSSNQNRSVIRSIKTWFDDADDGTEINQSVKLMIRGNGNVGKSTLINALQNGKCSENLSSTHGVKIENLQIELDSKPVELVIWDFGGQEIFHGTHRIFHQIEGVQIIAYDPDAESRAEANEWVEDRVTKEKIKHQPLPYWLEKSGHKNKFITPIVVQTKREEYPDRKVEAYELAAKLNVDFQHVDSMTGQGISSLRAKVHELATESIGYGMPIPTPWFLVRNHFLEMITGDKDIAKTIEVDDFLKVCDEKGVKSASCMALLEFLNTSGVLFYDAKFLRNTILINQKWALEAIYKPLDRESEFYDLLRNDLVGRVRVKHLFREFQADHSIEESWLFLNFMRSSGMCFAIDGKWPVKDVETYLVFPEFLSPKMTIEAETLLARSKHGFHHFRLQLPYLSIAALHALIVELGPKTRHTLLWRTGLVLVIDECLIHIEGNLSECYVDYRIELPLMPEWHQEIQKKLGFIFNEVECTWFEILTFEEAERRKKNGEIQDNSNPQIPSLGNDASIDDLPEIEQVNPKRLVVSFASKDIDKMKDIELSLRPTINNGTLNFLYDEKVKDGTKDWDPAIQEMFEDADGYLILVSPHYLDIDAHDYIHTTELPIIKRRHQELGIPVYCLTVTPTDYDDSIKDYGAFEGGKTYLPDNETERFVILNRFKKQLIDKHFLKLA
jgi:internalin A